MTGNIRMWSNYSLSGAPPALLQHVTTQESGLTVVQRPDFFAGDADDLQIFSVLTQFYSVSRVKY